MVRRTHEKALIFTPSQLRIPQYWNSRGRVYTVFCITRPGHHPKTFGFENSGGRIYTRIGSGSRIRYQILPGTCSSMWFFEVVILEITIWFLNLYGRFCPYNPPYQPKKKSAPSLFLKDENIFQNSASVVLSGIATEFVPQRLIS
jgi:hypothetical protein